MFKINISNDIINHCNQQIKMYNFGKRASANGTPEQQLTGIIGQSAIMKKFGLGFIDGSKGCDNGQDICYDGLIIDVKTMGRTVDVRPDYVSNFMGVQLKFNTDLFIFCSLNKNNYELTVCGWIPKNEFIKKADFYPKGSIRTRSNGSKFKTFSDLYEIKNYKLYNVNSFDELITSIRNYYNKNYDSRQFRTNQETHYGVSAQ